MTAEQFAYWLQGYAELNPDTPPSAEQWALIREHLKLVFNKVTPPLQFTDPQVPHRVAPPYLSPTVLPPSHVGPATVTC